MTGPDLEWRVFKYLSRQSHSLKREVICEAMRGTTNTDVTEVLNALRRDKLVELLPHGTSLKWRVVKPVLAFAVDVSKLGETAQGVLFLDLAKIGCGIKMLLETPGHWFIYPTNAAQHVATVACLKRHTVEL